MLLLSRSTAWMSTRALPTKRLLRLKLCQIEEQYRQKRMAHVVKWQQQSEINSMLGAAVDSLQGGATNALTGLIGGTQSLLLGSTTTSARSSSTAWLVSGADGDRVGQESGHRVAAAAASLARR